VYHFVIMRNDESTGKLDVHILKALANARRLQILAWLKEPRRNFPPQVDGDPVKDGVCADFIREKLAIAAATASQHLSLLVHAHLLIATRKKGWTFYRRNESAIARFARSLGKDL
jgi:DNA-binding transcriptional ArsR family regulator